VGLAVDRRLPIRVAQPSPTADQPRLIEISAHAASRGHRHLRLISLADELLAVIVAVLTDP
jgi:hypothetical protein